MLLISLIGEQPIPNLLVARLEPWQRILLVYTARTENVARHLRSLLSGRPDLGADLRTEPYDFNRILADLRRATPPDQPATINLTGGTKVMMLAAYELARQRQYPCLYLQSEQSGGTLHRYTFQDGQLQLLPPQPIPPNQLTIDDYLRAHLPGYQQEGPHRDENGRLSEGGRFEQAVCEALKIGCDEVMAGVRPAGVAQQIEIDLLIRCGNAVGIAEIKLGGKDSGKRGLDQLKMAGEPTYLGTYTRQFLITAQSKLPPRISTLARERGVQVIYLPEYQDGQPLPAPAAERLCRQVRQALGAEPAPERKSGE